MAQSKSKFRGNPSPSGVEHTDINMADGISPAADMWKAAKTLLLVICYEDGIMLHRSRGHAVQCRLMHEDSVHLKRGKTH